MGVILRQLQDVSSSLVRRASAPEQVCFMFEYALQLMTSSYSRLVSSRVSILRQSTLMTQSNYGCFSSVRPTAPVCLFRRRSIVRAVIIIAMTQFLALIGSRIRQPRVIAEVIGGVLLGPSVMGRIPGFTNHIFPPTSLPMLNLTSTIGLILFLFLIGLEVDVRLMKRNMRSSMVISVAGLIIPLGLGAALAVPIYHEFIDPSVKFGQFVLFVAVAIGITAFPVLCRILTETRLLETHVGVVVLSAGVGNDVRTLA